MAGEFALSSGYLADFASLASGFESGALGGEEAFGVIGVLEANNGIVLSANPTLSDLLIAYKQAVAFGNRNLMRQYGTEIARIIRDHASAFNRLLQALPRESRFSRFARPEKIRAQIQEIFLPHPPKGGMQGEVSLSLSPDSSPGRSAGTEPTKKSPMLSAGSAPKVSAKFATVDQNKLREVGIRDVESYTHADERGRIEMLKEIVEKHSPGGTEKVSRWIADLGIATEDGRIAIAKIAAAQDGGRMSRFIQNYGITSQEALIKIAKIAVAQDGRETSQFFHFYGIKSEAARIEIAKVAVSSDLSALEFSNFCSSRLRSLQITPAMTCEDIIGWARETLPAFDLPAYYTEALYADMRRRDVGIHLFVEMLLQSLEDPKGLANAAQKGPKALSRYLFAKASGIEIEGFETVSYREKALGDLYEGGLTLKGEVPLHISGSIAQDRDLTAVRKLIASVGRLHGISGKEEREKTKITSENIGRVIEDTDKAFLKIFQEVFKIGDHQITMEEIHALEEKWGNLEVFLTLVARFQRNSAWRQEIPVLGRVVEAVLAGKFAKLKFEGMEEDAEDQAKAKAQTAMLKTPEQRAGWQKDFHRIGVHNKITEGPTPEENLQRSQKILKNQVMGHARKIVYGAHPGTIDQIKEELRRKGLQLEGLKELRNRYRHRRNIVLLAALKLAQETQNPSDYLNILKFIKGNDGLFGLTTQLRDDLKTLDETARARVKSEEAIVFTTTTADSKLLLMTGDLVGVSSCQNYKTGAYIETLLGYVIDAGVKLILTYTLTRKNFATDAEFERGKDLFRREPSFRLTNPNKFSRLVRWKLHCPTPLTGM